MEKALGLIFSFYISRFFCPFLYLTPHPIKAYIRLISGIFKPAPNMLEIQSLSLIETYISHNWWGSQIQKGGKIGKD
jgi:hypothetical protein